MERKEVNAILTEDFLSFLKINQLYGTLEESSYKKETLRFLEFLHTISKRNPGEYTKLCFIGDKIKIGIIFVA